MLLSDLGRATVVGLMFLVLIYPSVWMIYGLLLLQSALSAFFEPARSAILPDICKAEWIDGSKRSWCCNLVSNAGDWVCLWRSIYRVFWLEGRFTRRCWNLSYLCIDPLGYLSRHLRRRKNQIFSER